MGNKTPDLQQRIRDHQTFGEEGGVVPVIDVASTSTFLNPEDMEKAFHGEMTGCYLYSRHSNPTVSAFGRKLAAMENMEAALGVSSGMAAIAATIEQLVPAGGHVVSAQTVYGGTYALFANLLPRRGVGISFVDTDNLEAVEKAIRPETRVLYTETMSNPLLAVSNLPKLAAIAHKRGIKLVVDNTFTPTLVTPSRYGADVVVYSCTKYISGASDMIAGAIVASKDFITSLVDLHHGSVMLTGPVMDPRVAHELYLRMDHLPLRMAAHSKSAQFMAEKMETAGVKVIYPGLKGHKDHALFKELLNPGMGFGGMISIDCGTTRKAFQLSAQLQEVKFGLYAVSLGFSRTLMSCPSVSTSSEIPHEDQEKMHLTPGLLRLSIGFTGDDETMWERFISCYRSVMGS